LRVLVLGAGIAGLSIAYELSRRGAGVTIVDPGGPGGVATGRSAGIVSLQLPWRLVSWALESMHLYERFRALRRIPGILVAPMECVERVLSWADKAGIEAGPLSPGEASRMLGIPLEPPSGWALAYSMDALVDLEAAVRGFLGELERLGARLEARGCRGLYEALRDYDAVIVAAGAWTPRLLGVPPEEIAGSAIYKCEASSVHVPGSLRALLYVEHEDRAAYAAPEAPERAIVGDGPSEPLRDPGEASPRPATPYEVLEELARVSPAFERAYPETSWAAPCLIAGDGLPVVGEWTSGVYILTGLDGYGLMVAPALASMLADNITRGTPLPPTLDPHRRPKPWEVGRAPPEPWRGC